MYIDTNKYFKILKDNKILEAFEKERDRGFPDANAVNLVKKNVLIGIILYFYILSGTESKQRRGTSTKIRHIKLLRDCTRWGNGDVINLRSAKVLVEAFIDLDFIDAGIGIENYGTFGIKDIGICLRDELAECVSYNMDTLIAKFMLLGDATDGIKAYLSTRK